MVNGFLGFDRDQFVIYLRGVRSKKEKGNGAWGSYVDVRVDSQEGVRVEVVS